MLSTFPPENSPTKDTSGFDTSKDRASNRLADVTVNTPGSGRYLGSGLLARAAAL